TLFSGTSAFRAQASGELLNGNADGPPGDPYVATFAAVASPKVLSVPDFARGPGQPVDLPATADNDLPLRLTSTGNVTTLDFNLRYAPSLLTVSGYMRGADLPAEAQLAVDLSVGLVHVAITSAAALPAGTIELVQLVAAVPDMAPYGRKQVLDLDNLQA